MILQDTGWKGVEGGFNSLVAVDGTLVILVCEKGWEKGLEQDLLRAVAKRMKISRGGWAVWRILVTPPTLVCSSVSLLSCNTHQNPPIAQVQRTMSSCAVQCRPLQTVKHYFPFDHFTWLTSIWLEQEQQA